jgi:putative transposase
MAKIEPYSTDLRDAEWEQLRRLLPGPKKLGRPPRYPQRLMLNAIFYVTHGGVPWRLLPHEFPHWRLVYYYFAKWQKEGVWEKLNAALRDRVRVQAGKKKPPRRRPLIAKALKLLASVESVALMQAKRSWGENGTFWSTPWV